jgi:hypothetical protein
LLQDCDCDRCPECGELVDDCDCAEEPATEHN